MRIVIDMQGAQADSRLRGIGRYTLAITQAIIHQNKQHQIFLVLNGLLAASIEPIRAAFEGILPDEHIHVWMPPIPVTSKDLENESWQETAELIREAFLVSLNPDVVLICSLFERAASGSITSIGRFSPLPTAVIFYDLIPYLQPELYLLRSEDKSAYLRKIDDLKRADILLSISEYSRQEAISTFGMSPETIKNISSAADVQFQPRKLTQHESDQIKHVYQIRGPFILYTGGLDPRKNIERLLTAFATLPEVLSNSYQLVIVCDVDVASKARFKKLAKKAKLKESQWVLTGFVSDQDLVALYNLCALFISPSLSEGFGLPVLEAMSCGAPVLAANATSLPEVVELSDALFDPFSIEDMRNKMMRALTDETFRERLRHHGLMQAQQFSWEKSASQVLATLEILHQKKVVAHLSAQSIIDQLLTQIADLTTKKIKDRHVIAIAQAIASNMMPVGRQPKLYLDLSALVQRDDKSGIQRVVKSIMHELLLTPPSGYEVAPIYMDQNIGRYRYAHAYLQGLLGTAGENVADDSIEPYRGDILLGLDLAPEVIQAEGYLDSLIQRGVYVYFIVYDLLPILLSEKFPPGFAAAHAKWLRVVAKSHGAICISKTVADELVTWLQTNQVPRVRPLKIGWFHLGADLQASFPSQGLPLDAEATLQQLEKQATFLMVGTIEPRKGYQQTLEAFEQLWQENIPVNLVIIGQEGWMVEQLVQRLKTHPELNKRLFWLSGVSDQYMEKIYVVSDCLLASSEGEGFGLPLIEAAQHKLPIIARDIPVFREIAGEQAYYFKGLGRDDMAAAIKTWLTGYQEHSHPQSTGVQWQTWQESTQQLLAVMLKGQWYTYYP